MILKFLYSNWMLCGSVSMFKGSLLSKGGHLTRRFAEVMLILLCCPTIIILFLGLSFWPSERFFHTLKATNSKKTQRSDIKNPFFMSLRELVAFKGKIVPKVSTFDWGQTDSRVHESSQVMNNWMSNWPSSLHPWRIASFNNISNILRYLYEGTHLWSETTPC